MHALGRIHQRVPLPLVCVSYQHHNITIHRAAPKAHSSRRHIMKWIDQTLDDMNTDPIMKEVVTESTTAAIFQTALLALYAIMAISLTINPSTQDSDLDTDDDNDINVTY